MDDTNPRSTARIAGHPIHPMLVPFPIVFLVSTLLSDLAYWQTRSPFWTEASLYLLAAAILTALAAAAAGLTDFIGDRRIRQIAHAWQHMLGNVVVVLLSIFNLYIRLGDPGGAILPLGLLVSAAAALLLGFTGWLGGDLVFRHRVGVHDAHADHHGGVASSIESPRSEG